MTPNDPYSGRTAPLTPKRCILYIYSTNIRTEYFKHGIYSPFFSSSKRSLFQNYNIFGSCIIHILYKGCAKIKKNNSGTKRLKYTITHTWNFYCQYLLFTTTCSSWLGHPQATQKKYTTLERLITTLCCEWQFIFIQFVYYHNRMFRIKVISLKLYLLYSSSVFSHGVTGRGAMAAQTMCMCINVFDTQYLQQLIYQYSWVKCFLLGEYLL